MLFGEEISDFRASLGLSLSLTLSHFIVGYYTRISRVDQRCQEILLGLEIFTDWTREYKFCGAKLEGGCCNASRKKYNLTRTLDGV